MDKLKQIVEAKFNQNHVLRDKLVATGSHPLIEATFDLFWGAGATLSTRKIREGTWVGRNIFGSILNDVRTEMRCEVAALASKHQQSTPAKQQSNVQNRSTAVKQLPTSRPTQPPPPPPSETAPPNTDTYAT